MPIPESPDENSAKAAAMDLPDLPVVILLEPGKPTKNGNIYPAEILREMVVQAHDLIRKNTLLVRGTSNVTPSPEPIGFITDTYLNDAGALCVQLKLTMPVPEDTLDYFPCGIGSVSKDGLISDYTFGGVTAALRS